RVDASIAQRVSLERRGGEERAERARVAAVRLVPVQAVSRPRVAHDLLRVGTRGAVARPARVLPLRLDVCPAGLDRGQLVAADTAVQELVSPRDGVEPPSVGRALERDGERPVLLPEVRDDMAVVEGLESRPDGGGGHEPCGGRPVIDRIARGDDVLGAGTEDGDELRLIVSACGVHEGVHRVLRAREAFLRRGGRAETGDGDHRRDETAAGKGIVRQHRSLLSATATSTTGAASTRAAGTSSARALGPRAGRAAGAPGPALAASAARPALA